MQIHFKNIHPGLEAQVIPRAQRKIERLSKLIDEGRFETQVSVELQKETGSKQSAAAWRASINLDARGERFHADTVQSTPGAAMDRAIAELQAELRTHRTRMQTDQRKNGEFWKLLLQRDVSWP
mgnify:CR=1 FL=1